MRVLVVGGTNFIGPEVVRRLQEHGADVTVLHRGEHEEDLGDARHVHADRSEVGRVASELEPDVILDMVPIHARHGSEITDAARNADVRRVVAVSSVDTYRGYDVVHRRDPDLQEIPFRESDEVRRHRYPYRPAISIRPVGVVTRCARSEKRLVLPAPLGPRSAQKWPRSTENETSIKTEVVP